MVTPPPRTQVYLYPRAGLRGFSGVSSALLELTDSMVRCTLIGKAGYSGWIAKRLQMPDLKERLKAGQHVSVFEFPRNAYQIQWPALAAGTAFKISQGGADWVVGFNPPRGTSPDNVIAAEMQVERVAGLFSGADARKQWRQALDPTGQHVPSSYQRPYAAPAAPRPQTPPTLPPPGWYPDPTNARAQRYWDGTRWTSFAQPPDPGHP